LLEPRSFGDIATASSSRLGTCDIGGRSLRGQFARQRRSAIARQGPAYTGAAVCMSITYAESLPRAASWFCDGEDGGRCAGFGRGAGPTAV